MNDRSILNILSTGYACSIQGVRRSEPLVHMEWEKCRSHCPNPKHRSYLGSSWTIVYPTHWLIESKNHQFFNSFVSLFALTQALHPKIDDLLRVFPIAFLTPAFVFQTVSVLVKILFQIRYRIFLSALNSFASLKMFPICFPHPDYLLWFHFLLLDRASVLSVEYMLLLSFLFTAWVLLHCSSNINFCLRAFVFICKPMNLQYRFPLSCLI